MILNILFQDVVALLVRLRLELYLIHISTVLANINAFRRPVAEFVRVLRYEALTVLGARVRVQLVRVDVLLICWLQFEVTVQDF